MVEVEDIRMKKPFEDNTFIIVEGKSVEGLPSLRAHLFLPPNRYEYLATISMSSRELSAQELEDFLEEVEKLAKKTLERHRLELILGKKGYQRI
ncbi:MAG: hypothetical protein QMC98_03395 [Candidatus Thermoplasmatota archaeon]|nr:hypothetical protein [Candidatus Thermoplasmatota archaeon]